MAMFTAKPVPSPGGIGVPMWVIKGEGFPNTGGGSVVGACDVARTRGGGGGRGTARPSGPRHPSMWSGLKNCNYVNII